MQQEDVVLAKVIGVVIKDLLEENVDTDSALAEESTSYSSYFDTSDLPLLESADDEDEHFFKKYFQQNLQRHGNHRQQIEPATATIRPPVKRSSDCISLDSSSSSMGTTNNVQRSTAKRKCVELNLLNRFKPALFENKLHMRKMTFLRVFQVLRNVLSPTGTFPAIITPQNAFSLSLWKLSTAEHYEQIANKFHIPLPECQATIQRFSQLISANRDEYIAWPQSSIAQESTLMGFRTHAQFKQLPDFFGVVANKHLNMFLENLGAEVAVVLQIVCNADLRILDCHVELEQNYSFENSLLGQRLGANTVESQQQQQEQERSMPPNSYILGDETFPLKSYLMRPFGSVCSKKERKFNELLQPAISLGRQTLVLVTQRFHILHALEAKNLDEGREIIETVCALHNLCIDVEDDCIEFVLKGGKLNSQQAQASGEAHLDLGESNVEGLRRRYELLDAVVGVLS